METMQQETIDKVRAAIKDRATWFALLYKSFKEALPEEECQKLARKAIFEFGLLKANFGSSAVPEPHSLTALLLAPAVLRRRLTRRR